MLLIVCVFLFLNFFEFCLLSSFIMAKPTPALCFVSDGENEISGSSSDSAVRHSHQKSKSAFKTWLR